VPIRATAIASKIPCHFMCGPRGFTSEVMGGL
jgi:hypothetical protein